MRISKIICTTFFLLILTLVGCSSKSEADSSKPKESQEHQSVDGEFAEMEEEFGAKIGIYAIDTGTGKTIAYREDERFAYASTFKALAAGVLMQQKSLDELEQVIHYTRDDLDEYAPITEKHVETGMTLKELCDAAIRYSDNTAGNLILKQLGGPDGFEQSLRELGDEVTNPERYEPELNDVKPGETHDTSTPKALASSFKALTVGDALPEDKRELLIDWLVRNTTGDELIRAGVPDGWIVGDKSGLTTAKTRNDIAIIWPEEGDPIVLAILSGKGAEDGPSYDGKVIAEATRLVVDSFEKK